jgi:hypothetical protein
MIQEDYVSFETAKLLKEKGFDARCPMIYTVDGKMLYTDVKHHNMYAVTNKQLEYYTDIIAPTLQMAMKWLRKNYQIFIRPNTSFLYPIKWYSEIFCYGDNLKTQQDIKTEYYDSPEEACEAAIKYCLEHLI